MMKVEIRKARVKVTARFKNEGSVLRETIDAQGVGFETDLDVESDAPPERVAAVVRNSEKGCYVMQTILKPTPVETRVTLNGADFDPSKKK
jgi:uncharacterized OsmC-like protein